VVIKFLEKPGKVTKKRKNNRMSTLMLFNEKSSRSLSEFQFVHDPKDSASKLGKGSFASVQLIEEKKTGNLYALKMITLNPLKISRSEIQNLRSEIQIHKQLDHPNIIKFHNFIQESTNVYLILDYAPNGTLYTYLHRKKHLTPNEVFHCFYQTCLAIQYLHQKDIVHRDIKPENLLLDKDLNIKLCDFGWAARSIREKRTTFCGTYEYMAPEIVRKKAYDYRVDIWSLGVLLYELVHREAPYKGRSLPEIINSFANTTLTFDASIQPEVKDLIGQILKIDPTERISLTEILSHPWIKYHLSKCEYAQNAMAKPCSAGSTTEVAPSPRLAQNFGSIARNQSKENKDLRVFTPERMGDFQRRNLIIQHSASAVNYRVKEENRQLSPASACRVMSSASKPLADNTLDLQNIQNTVGNENFYINKEQAHSSTSLGRSVPSSESRKISNDPKSRKVFQKDIMSPDFQVKLSSILGHLNVGSPLNKKNDDFSNVPTAQSYNQEVSPAPVSRLDVTGPYVNEWSILPEGNTPHDPSPRVWPPNLNPKLPSPGAETVKSRFGSGSCKSASRNQNSGLMLRTENTQPSEESQGVMSPTFKINFISKTKPDTLKGNIAKQFVFEADNSSVRSKVNLNDTLPRASHLKKARGEERDGYESNTGNPSSGIEHQRKPINKLLEVSLRGLPVPYVVKYSKNKENRVETHRGEKPVVIQEKLYSHR